MIKVCTRFTFGEAQTGEIAVDPGVPSIGCLLETVQRSLESAHVIILIKILEAFWLLDIHLLLNNSIEECCFQIHLMDLPPHMCS